MLYQFFRGLCHIFLQVGDRVATVAATSAVTASEAVTKSEAAAETVERAAAVVLQIP